MAHHILMTLIYWMGIYTLYGVIQSLNDRAQVLPCPLLEEKWAGEQLMRILKLFSFVTFSIHLLNWRSFIVFYVLLGFLKPEQ